MITLIGYPNSDDAVIGTFDYGQLRDVTSPGAGDGSPWRKDIAQDIYYAIAAVCKEGGQAPSGSQETTSSSQFLTAIKEIGKSVTGNFSVTGTGTFGGLLTVASGGASITGNSTINGTLSGLTGLTVASGGASITGNSTIAGTLSGLTGLTVASGGASITGSGTFSGLLTAANFKTGSSSGNITNTGTGGIGGCISILGTVSLNTSTTDPSAISIGYNSSASGHYSTALGYNSTASGNYSTALGDGSVASGTRSTASGLRSTAEGTNSTALGSGSKAEGTNSTALGNGSTAEGGYSTALGDNSSASRENSTALGYNSTASGNFSTALGNGSTASGDSSTALGYNSKAEGDYSTALGCYATTPTAVSNYIKIGMATSNIYTQKAINVISDKRDKTNIEDNDLGLDFINAIRTVKYNQNSRENYYKKDEDGKLLRDKKGHRILDEEAYSQAELKSKRKYRGVIAQEVEKLWDTMDFSAVHHTIHNYEDAEDQYSVNYEQFIPVLIKAVQELSKKNDELTAEIELLK